MSVILPRLTKLQQLTWRRAGTD